ncbi:DUF7793 family protein [Ulvibacter litoralis]|uniref:DUF7793 domain-containing protein n=2 Tax=Ulvibacter litoralis TaxID=227084 RepID=A0A1G7HPU4_9FLAO|nr:hypothetical protein [Ulvibacter litoralis]SDF02358.1 hypothetical protein SAMN05421855_104216 [Ulvibacter litoralis]
MMYDTITPTIKFWIDQHIIHCEIYSGFGKINSESEIEKIFINEISTISEGKFLPILINLREVNDSSSIRIFKLLSRNTKLNSLVLSKTFLVKSYSLKGLLLIYNFTSNLIVPNTVFNDYDLAIADCTEVFKNFNGKKKKKTTVQIEDSRFWIEDGILFCHFKNKDANYKLDTAKVEIFIKTVTKLCNGKAMPFLIDARDSRGTFSSEAATLFAKSPKLVNLRISEAFLLNSIGIKLLITSYKRIYDPITPYAVFSNINAAKQYCIESKNKYYGIS